MKGNCNDHRTGAAKYHLHEGIVEDRAKGTCPVQQALTKIRIVRVRAEGQNINGRVECSGIIYWQTVFYGIFNLAAENFLRIVPFGIPWRRQSDVSHSACDIAPYRHQQVMVLAVGLEDSISPHWYPLELNLLSGDIFVGRYVGVAEAVVDRDVDCKQGYGYGDDPVPRGPRRGGPQRVPAAARVQEAARVRVGRQCVIRQERQDADDAGARARLNDQRANTIADIAAVLGGLGKGNKIVVAAATEGESASASATEEGGAETQTIAPVTTAEGKTLLPATVFWADRLDRNYAKKWTKNVRHELFEEAVLQKIAISDGSEDGELQRAPAELAAEQELQGGAEQSQRL
ncbi:hypothetical protein NUW58_g8499 [Xylaria curta]|uniref:Uncharacterized protein n=1 Tax=Xylaria curta TaxID=42375 RepID=A0ACC1N6L5_9PEZI|nr:hypothetical protein NUW58_g8499 [Xylaria curta]